MAAVSWITFIYLLKILFCFQFCGCFEVVNFHEYCGATIHHEAGEVRFDAQQLPSYLSRNKCSVTINPSSNELIGGTHALFYFTKFDLSEPCSVMNVSVLDGSLFGGTRVEGLPEHICGRNWTLEGKNVFFTTKSDQFTVTFKGSDFGKYVKGNFTIKFIAFNYGHCKGKDVYECSNNYCIASKYTCSDDVNACGIDMEDQCKVLKAVWDLLETILKIIKDYFWVVILLISLCILRCIYKRNRDSICRLKDSICSKSTRRPRRRTSSPRLSLDDNMSVEFQRAERGEPTRNLRPRDTETNIHIPEFDVNSLHSIEFEEADLPNSRGANHDTGRMTSLGAQPMTDPPSYDDLFGRADKQKTCLETEI